MRPFFSASVSNPHYEYRDEITRDFQGLFGIDTETDMSYLTFSSLTVPRVVKMTTLGAVSDANFVKMMTFQVQWTPGESLFIMFDSDVYIFRIINQIILKFSLKHSSVRLMSSPKFTICNGLLSDGTSEWVIKFNGLSRTANNEVHVIHTSRAIIAYIHWNQMFKAFRIRIFRHK